MSEPPVRGIVVGHGGLAAGLVDAARRIVDADEDALRAVSNQGLSPDAIREAVSLHLGPGPAILFTDMQSGSCGMAARRLVQGRADVVVVSGVNLPLLLDFLTHRELPLAELVPRLLNTGRRGICCAPLDFESDAHRAVQSG
jgi:mannose/fructose-specific phosphotransferase system component IIA